MAEFISIFKEYEEELQATNADFVAQVHSLIDKNVLRTKELKDNFAPAFTTSISRPTHNCGSTKKKHKSPARVSALEEQVRALQNAKLEEDKILTQKVVAQEEKLMAAIEDTGDNQVVENEQEECKHVVQNAYLETRDSCGFRHSMEHRECNFCGEVHTGCCEL